MARTVDAPKLTTPAFKDGKKSATPPSRSQGLTFAIAALDMSWRLAFVVLVPILAGVELDKHLHTSPAFIIIGFIVAMVGLFVVLRQAVSTADEKFGTTPKEDSEERRR